MKLTITDTETGEVEVAETVSFDQLMILVRFCKVTGHTADYAAARAKEWFPELRDWEHDKLKGLIAIWLDD